jgi:diguanylate cyclase (GGDEF)-like protein
MARRITLVAACVDAAMLVLFLALGSPILAWMNLVGMAMYATAYWCLGRRLNAPAVALIWVEVLGHAAIGTLLVGWNSGFHYYLLMFIPAIVVSSRWREAIPMLVVLYVTYLGMYAASRHYGISAPLSETGLWIVQTFNVAVVFAMAAYTARFYYGMVRSAERKLVELATKDSLTGLSNRGHMLALAEHEIARARRSGQHIALIIADIDHFKKINDGRGHEAGDKVLAHTGKLLASLCREQDVVARWGGEEFLILLPATVLASAHDIAERLRSEVAATPVVHGNSCASCSLSLGVTTLAPSESFNTAIARADRALYRSKAEGRNRVTVMA